MKPALLSSRDLGMTVGAALARLQHLQLPGEQAVTFLQKYLPPRFRVVLDPPSQQDIAQDSYASLSMRYIYRRPSKEGMQARTVDVTVYLRQSPELITSLSSSLGA
ncbi:hypothetical protein J4208_01915 [Candidatus Woesearchaeota archaeon]|nr:hypothetical protein [Candidatus Woesearchaeota archaeon]